MGSWQRFSKQIAHTLKGTTARSVFQRFPEGKKHFWGGASHGLVLTQVGRVGDMSVDTVLKYIELGQDEDGKGGYRFDRMTFKDPFDILGCAPSLPERSSDRCKSGRAKGPSKLHRSITGRSKPNRNSCVGVEEHEGRETHSSLSESA